MSHDEIPVTDSRVSVFRAADPSPEERSVGAEPDFSGRDRHQSHQIESRPDTRSPLDPWHSEAYLIRCLVRMHGWRVIEPGVLQRGHHPRYGPPALVMPAAAQLEGPQALDVA